jgi:hypothetical protein
MPLPREHLLDELATAYMQTVAALAGATIAVSRRDYGVDGVVKDIEAGGKDGYFETGFPVEFQLKGTAVAGRASGFIKHDLRARNYNLIVSRSVNAIPYYLFLVCFDEVAANWAVVERQKLVMNVAAFWWKESGKRTENAASVRIEISEQNRLTPDAIRGMLDASQARIFR